MTSSERAIVVQGLHVRRGGSAVLAGISLEVAPGTVTGLLGPSGCGKTTLMRAIVGAQRIESGRVEVLGEPAGSRSLRSRVGYMTQAPSVYPDLSVHENLEYFARVLGASQDALRAVLTAVRLDHHAKRSVARLSAGERARVSLAATMLGEPDVLVLDEPTVGLDPLLRRDLWETFHALAAGGATLLVSSHVMDEAARCDHLLLMREGAIVAAGTPAGLRERAGVEDLSEAFLRLIEREQVRV